MWEAVGSCDPTRGQAAVKVAGGCRGSLGPWAYSVSHASDLNPRNISSQPLSKEDRESHCSQSHSLERPLAGGPWVMSIPYGQGQRVKATLRYLDILTIIIITITGAAYKHMVPTLCWALSKHYVYIHSLKLHNNPKS